MAGRPARETHICTSLAWDGVGEWVSPANECEERGVWIANTSKYNDKCMYLLPMYVCISMYMACMYVIMYVCMRCRYVCMYTISIHTYQTHIHRWLHSSKSIDRDRGRDSIASTLHDFVRSNRRREQKMRLWEFFFFFCFLSLFWEWEKNSTDHSFSNVV